MLPLTQRGTLSHKTNDLKGDRPTLLYSNSMPTSKCGLILHMSHHKTDQTYPTHEAEQHILLNGS